MTNRTAARRYARALFDVALTEKGNLPQVEAELAGFVDLFRQYPTLEKVLINPAVPAPRKREAVLELTRCAKMSGTVAKLLVLLAERDRLVLVDELLAAYRDRLLEHQTVVRANVTTATPLEPGRAEAIQRTLAHATGRTVTLATQVDPSLIGGLVARIGSTVYDGSMARQLEKMKQRLEAGS